MMVKKTTQSNPDVDSGQEALDAAIKDLIKRFGEGSIMTLGDATHMQVDCISTGSLTLDLALGGGVPRGRIIEIYGPESSGKTTLCLHIVAEAQKSGGRAAFIDMEHALDPRYAGQLGVDTEHLYISQPDSGEQAMEICETLVRSGSVDVVVVDSVAALVPEKELEGDMGDAVMGMQARLMSQALRKLAGAIATTRTVVIFTNQLRMKIGVIFGNPETTPGGQALKFYASQRMDIRKIQNLKKGEEVLGVHTRVRVVKNKIAPPFRTAEFDIVYGKGISKVGEVLDLGVSLDVIKKAGAFFSYGDTRLGQGRENAKSFLETAPEILEAIEAEIRQKGKEGVITFAQEAGSDD